MENTTLSSLTTSISIIGSQSISISPRHTQLLPLWRKDEPLPLSDSELKTLEATGPIIAHPSLVPQWQDHLRSGNTNVYITLLLSHLPKLKTLTLGHDFHRNNSHLSHLFRHAAQHSGSPQTPLSTLTSATLLSGSSYGPDRDYFHPHALSLLHFPHLTHLTSPLIAHRTLRFPLSTPPLCSTLISLSLPDCEIDESTLGQFLRCTPSLRRLHYDRHIDLDPQSSPPPANLSEWEWYNLPSLRRALAPLEAQLTHLSLGVMFFASTAIDVGQDARWGVRPSFGFFSSFTSLVELEVPFVVFPGMKLDGERMDELLPLPSSLKKLTFRNDLAGHDTYLWEPEEALSWLELLLVSKDECALGLEQVGLVVGEMHEYEWNEGQRAQFRRMCEEEGVRWSIRFDEGRD